MTIFMKIKSIDKLKYQDLPVLQLLEYEILLERKSLTLLKHVKKLQSRSEWLQETTLLQQEQLQKIVEFYQKTTFLILFGDHMKLLMDLNLLEELEVFKIQEQVMLKLSQTEKNLPNTENISKCLQEVDQMISIFS